ncbi:MAG: hypothetical protein ABIG44_04150 [Planctomycetota bacterium]
MGKGQKASKRWYQRRWVWVLIFIALIVLIRLTVLAPREVDIIIGHDTTRITGPVNPDGTVNYVAYLNEHYSRGVTKDNNAAVPLIQALGAEGFFLSESQDMAFEMLGMSTPIGPDEHFVPLARHASSNPASEGVAAGGAAGMEKQLNKASRAPWSADEYPVLAAWLKANESHLRLMVSASRRTHYYLPMVSPGRFAAVPEAMIRPSIGRLLEACASLSARAMLKAGGGQMEDAWQDILALHRLGRLIGRGATLIECMLGARFVDSASCCAEVLATSDALSSGQVRKHLADLQALEPIPTLVQVADLGERMTSLDAVMVMKRAAGPGVDWNDVLVKLNRHWDDHVAALTAPTYLDRTRAFDVLDARTRSMSEDIKESGHLKLLLFHLVGDPAQKARNGIATKGILCLTNVSHNSMSAGLHAAVMRFELSKVSMALAAFRAENGAYPTKLAELNLKAIPRDVFSASGGPLVYRAVAGGYVLYSVGMNGIDDGGARSDKNDEGDIVVRAGKAPAAGR